MSHRRISQTFTYKEAVFRICCDRFDTVTHEIVRQRQILQDYVDRHPDFQVALDPLEIGPDAPEVARRMAQQMIDEDPQLEAPELADLRAQVMRRYGKRLELGDVA